MSSLTVIALAIGLAMDAFAVAIAVGATLPQITVRQYFRLSFHFGLFQFLMPILGWYFGSKLGFELEPLGHWLAFGLLVVVGSKLLYETTRHRAGSTSQAELRNQVKDPTRKWSLISLSLATSIDALAVGLSVALLETEIISPSIVIGLVALLFTLIGMRFGAQLGKWTGNAAGYCGGVILIAIGTRILISHLLG